MKIVRALFLLLLTSCAGSIDFVGDPPELTVTAGGSAQVDLKLEVEGSYESAYDITATPDDSKVTATVSPTSADAKEGTPVVVKVTLNVAAAAVPGDRMGVYVEAKNEDHSAGIRVSVKVE